MTPCIHVVLIFGRRPAADENNLLEAHFNLCTPKLFQIRPRSTHVPSDPPGRPSFNSFCHVENVKYALFPNDPSNVHNPKWLLVMRWWRKDCLKVFAAKLCPDLIQRRMFSFGQLFHLSNTFR